MNQYTQVVALIRKKDRVLFLKKSEDQGELAGTYELPGGSIRHGEQPEEALLRCVKESTGLSVSTPYLSDVFTFIDELGSGRQYIVVAYEIVSLSKRDNIVLSQEYSRYAWERLGDTVPSPLVLQSRVLLDMYESKVSKGKSGSAVDDEPVPVDEKDGAIVYSDGGSRGNPGPSAAGYVILDANNRLIYEGGAYLGITTNNLAEYHGVYLGLEKARSLGLKSLEFRIDSMLVVNQLKGIYTIRNRELWPIHERIRDLLGGFDRVVFRHVKREFNQQADGMVNKILDTRTGK